jgi:hypothetical protein
MDIMMICIYTHVHTRSVDVHTVTEYNQFQTANREMQYRVISLSPHLPYGVISLSLQDRDEGSILYIQYIYAFIHRDLIEPKGQV